MLTLEKVIAIIRDSHHPCWKLSSKHGYDRAVPIGSYFPLKKGKAKSEDDDYEEKELDSLVEGSIVQLQNSLEFYKGVPGLTFEITISRFETSNGSKNTIGPLKFSIESGATGIPTPHMPDHFAHNEKMFDRRMEVERVHTGLEVDRANFNYEKLREWDKINQAKEDLKKEKEEVEKLRLKYEDHSERVKHGATKAAVSLFEKFMPKEGEKGIGAVEGKVEETPPTDQEKLIEGLAKEIHEKVTDVTEIKVIGAMVMKFIKDPKDEIFQKFRTNLSIAK